MKGLKTKMIVEDITLTAEDWQLYTCGMDCDEAAQALNEAFKTAVDHGCTASEVRTHMSKVQNTYASFGAYDSEPDWVVRQLIYIVFGEEA